MLQRSIAARLFLWLFAAGLGALLIGGGVLYLEIRSLILSALDHTLESDVEIFSGLLHEEADGELEFEYEEVHSGDYITPGSGHYYEVFVHGDLFAFSPSLAGERLDLASGRLEHENRELGQRIFTAAGPGGEAVRALEKKGMFAGRPGKIVAAHSLKESREILRRFRSFLLGLGPAAILLIALVGLLITHRSLRPLRAFSDAVRRTTEKTLDLRVDAGNQYREFSALAVSFNEMLERLQESLAAREHLLSDVSHELKTPVAVIRSHCDVYLQRTRLPEEYVEALETIRETADVMGVKIRRLLSLAQIEADLMAAGGFQVVSVGECLRQARVTVEPLARERQVILSEDIGVELRVLGHQERLVEAFSNLLENAIKYNHAGGRVEIAAQGRREGVQVRITDTGCGIDSEELSRIFDRFYRGNQSRKTEGTGLGLCLVKSIIEAHAGSIEVSSRKGEGSCFTVTFPR